VTPTPQIVQNHEYGAAEGAVTNLYDENAFQSNWVDIGIGEKEKIHTFRTLPK